MVAVLNATAYRILRDVRREGSLSWPELETRIQDRSHLEGVLDWLQHRNLVDMDATGVNAC